MHPILFRVGEFELHSFGLMMALAWMAASVYLDRRFVRLGLPRDASGELVIWALAGALAGARALYLVVEYPSWTDDLRGAVFSRSGFVFYGGLFGGIVAGWFAMRRRGLAPRVVADAAAPAIALGIGVGRIGCFLAGDDYGLPTGVPWAVTFTDPQSLAPLGVPIHPVQIYLSLCGIGIFGALHVSSGDRKFDGRIFCLFMIWYSIGRFCLEFFRGDPRGMWAGLSTSQWISLFILPAGAGLYRKWSMEKT